MKATNVSGIYSSMTMSCHPDNATSEQGLWSLNDLTQAIQASPDLDTTLVTVTTGLRAWIRSDRLLIYQFLPAGDGVVLAEAITTGLPSLQGQLIYDPCFNTQWSQRYQQGHLSMIADRETANLVPCYRALLVQMQVRANLVVPILLPSQSSPSLWGLLIAHQCQEPRQWRSPEIQLLQQVAGQLSHKLLALHNPGSDQRSALQSQMPGSEPAHEPPGTVPPPPLAQTIPPQTLAYNSEGEAIDLRALDVLQNPVWVFDIEQLQMYWANRASLHLWNASSRQELLDRNFRDVSESTQIRLQTYLQQFQQGQTLVEQWTFYPGGEPISVQCRCSGLVIGPGRLAMLVEGTLEQAHQMDSDTLRAIEALRHTSVMISLYTWTGLPLLQNPAALQCYGDTAHPNLNTENAFRRHFVDPGVGEQAQRTIEAGHVFSIAAEMVTRAGIRWHGLDVHRVTDPVTGKPLILVNETDITEQQTALSDRLRFESELEAQRAFLRQVIDTVPSSIFVKDTQGRCLVVNQASTLIHASNVEAMIGKQEPEFNPHFAPEQLEEFLAINQSIMDSRQPQQQIQPITTASGERRWYQTVINPWIDPQGIVQGIIGNSVDITELKHIEAALEQKSERLATIITIQQDIALNYANLDETMAAIVEHAQELTRASGAVIELLEGDELVYRTVSGTAASHQGLRINIDTSLSGHCVRTGQTLLCNDVETDSRVDLIACRRSGVRSMVVVPLLSSGHRLGVLKVSSPHPNVFTDQDSQTLQLMAGFLSSAIQLATEFEAKTQLVQALQESQDRYRSVVTVLAEGVVLQQADGQITACNSSAEQILGLTRDQMMGRTSIDPHWQAVHEDGSAFPGEHHPAMVTLQTGEPQSNVVMGVNKPDGSLTWISINTQPLWHPEQSHPYAVVTSFIDITARKQADVSLRYQAERDRVLYAIAQRIRQSLDLDDILTTTVTEVRQFLQTDRVIIYRFNSDWSGVVTTESVAPGWKSILNLEIRDAYFVEHHEQAYLDPAIQIRDNIYTAGLSQCHIALLEELQVQAKLVVPIWQGATLWGLLVAHQCQGPRHWQPLESEILLQLATQLAIAIQQSELYQQVQHLNTHLELQVEQRTAELQQALNFEALLKRITDKVRDSLDEQEILRSAVQELASGLGTVCCDTGIYNADQTTSTIAYEFNIALSSAQGKTFAIANAPHMEVYQYLLQGQTCQFCDVAPNALRLEQTLLTVLACPLMDDQGVLGDLWLFKPSDAHFDDQEIRLVQQVANQCAIALRQSRLYHAAQTQVQELARLNQLKDDFLSTVSHELRTPMSSLQMALQMLEVCLHPLGVFQQKSNPIQTYFQIMQTECQREITLINDLLDLTRIDSESDPLNLSPIQLQFWIPHVLEPFSQRIYHQEQILDIVLPEHLPALTTDLSYLERVLSELVHNACKYTPAGERISITARVESDAEDTATRLLIEVSNSGVEIPEIEQRRIFDKFYRIPSNDPWKHGGTGLGLALVQKLIQKLGGTIQVQSGPRLTQFILSLPLG